MDGVNIRDQQLEVSGPGQTRVAEGYLHLPDLPRVASLHREVDRGGARSRARPRQELAAPLLKVGQNSVDTFPVELAGGGQVQLRELCSELRHQRSCGAERRCHVGDDHSPAPETAGKRDRVEPRRAATTHQGGHTWIDALIDSDFLDGADHVLGYHGQDGDGRLVKAKTERRRHVRVQGRGGGGRVES